MQKRFIFLALLTVLGIGLLAAGWQGGLVAVKDTAAPEVIKEGTPEGEVKDSANVLIKPDVTPPGNAVKVQGEDNPKPKSVKETAGEGSGYFVEYRLERERNRGYQIQILREIINNNNSDAENRKKAQEQMHLISSNMQKELEVENLIRAKGFRDAVVFLEGKNVTAVIQANSLTQEDAIKISDLVSRSTGVSQQSIVIIPKA